MWPGPARRRGRAGHGGGRGRGVSPAEVARVRRAQVRAAPWPYGELDVAGLRRAGRLGVPFREMVLKVHQRCNLACDYCYVYEHADQSWRDRPRVMSDAVRDAALGRFAEHARRHGLKRVRVVLHGGEPLLYGRERLAELAGRARAAFPAGCAVEIGMQTNGVLLDEATVSMLVECDIKVGVSVDGVAVEHDRHRRLPDGRGSFAAVERGLAILRKRENVRSYAGLLCTISAGTDPISCYRQLARFEPPMIDLLLPHANWEVPPWRPGGLGNANANADLNANANAHANAYAAWLIAVFDEWYAETAPPRIRLFDDAISLVLGGASRGEQLGLSPSGVVVVESDGAIEQVDALKSTYPGACATGLDVFGDDLDAALDDPGVVARQIGRAALSAECLSCPAVAFCGGGHYAHRYRRGVGFRAPSVYCADLRIFVQHVHERVTADVRRIRDSSPGATPGELYEDDQQVV
ncbi:FxsB family cyclophane-forming radical SAM/SPASM peptide maturase [Actinoplanes sp. GCM10030250]|uniref:FxsB family cyclophane-forming radical SAM/SPASM peptide maturase n=1 Tax=Actinoplanes sp. GCM10030250 TaxID=3273376 RepID=UPI00361C65BC